jgi:hypothetical protein
MRKKDAYITKYEVDPGISDSTCPEDTVKCPYWRTRLLDDVDKGNLIYTRNR